MLARIFSQEKAQEMKSQHSCRLCCSRERGRKKQNENQTCNSDLKRNKSLSETRQFLTVMNLSVLKLWSSGVCHCGYYSIQLCDCFPFPQLISQMPCQASCFAQNTYFLCTPPRPELLYWPLFKTNNPFELDAQQCIAAYGKQEKCRQNPGLLFHRR